jgi:hypothetical protein
MGSVARPSGRGSTCPAIGRRDTAEACCEKRAAPLPGNVPPELMLRCRVVSLTRLLSLPDRSGGVERASRCEAKYQRH